MLLRKSQRTLMIFIKQEVDLTQVSSSTHQWRIQDFPLGGAPIYRSEPCRL